MPTPHHIKTVSEYHRLAGLPEPAHPLVSVIRFEDIKRYAGDYPKRLMLDLYTIALKRNFGLKMKYGRQDFDFDQGVMHFMWPRQVLSFEEAPDTVSAHTGWLLLIHPDFLWNTFLAKKIKQYEFFGYQVSEALHLSEKEESLVTGILQHIEQEYHSRVDAYSQDVIVAQIELLLTYCERFYQRQFITRRQSNHHILARLEQVISDYFSDAPVSTGIPTVAYVADALHLSPGYLSRLLRTLTGLTTRQWIQDRIIELAKERLSTTSLTVSEIAYGLGFEHPQSFNKLFKVKTDCSPNQFRQQFN